MKVTEVSWQREQSALKSIRQTVFVEEQHVPLALEYDGEDEDALHWLASDDEDHIVGTLRMLRNGHIGRMAVLPYNRGEGFGRMLLRAALKKARQMDLKEVFLHAQLHARSFYERQGFQAHGSEFMDAGIPHIAMRLTLRDDFKLGQDTGRFSVTTPPEIAASLARQCRHYLRILSSALEPELYDSDAFVSTISQLARLHRNSEIRLLITDSETLNYGHQLIRLQQRLNSTIKVRLLHDDTAPVDENFLVADLTGLMVGKRHDMADYWADFNNRPLAKDYAHRFDELWNIAREDPNLKTLMI